MVLLGVILIGVGALAIVAAVVTAEGTVALLGTDLTALGIFLVGLGAGLALWWGFELSKFGTKRSLKHRRESKRLHELSQKLDEVEYERRAERGDPERHDDRPTL